MTDQQASNPSTNVSGSTIDLTVDLEMIATMQSQWLGLSQGETDFLVNSSQFCALIKQTLMDVSWAGFYWFRNEELVLGAFQGPVACARISPDKGVCGEAFTRNEIKLVDDVHLFQGHIACDASAESELVIPLEYQGRIIGVFDLDSYSKARFSHTMSMSLRKLLEKFVENTDFSMWLK